MVDIGFRSISLTREKSYCLEIESIKFVTTRGIDLNNFEELQPSRVMHSKVLLETAAQNAKFTTLDSFCLLA